MSELWSMGGKNTNGAEICKPSKTAKVANLPGVMIDLLIVFERLIWKVKLNETPMK